ncbi:MAG TPA: MFS transporter [Rhodopila sp.]|uniref:MFS transporter n=1 Tax=Rhodopila sp. TaxID=2480087 RepID=UPI002D106AF6|nr:MFS transporter [Rhodopila sp.]HVY14036.1 MFS transporter [Rhodopila sp.]
MALDVSEQRLDATRQRWVSACVLCGVALSSLDSAVANIALPTIARQLVTTDASTIWVVNGYQLSSAACLLPAAALGEILGLKRVYLFGLIVFMLSSMACALAPSIDVLVAARIAQGVGGSCMAALGAALIRAIYPRDRVGHGLALVALSVALSGAAGPTVGAFVLSVASWSWLFMINVPFCFVAVIIFATMAPAGTPSPRRFDWTGAVLSAAALSALILGVDSFGARAHGMAVAEVAAGVAGFALLFRLQIGRAAPLLPLDLLRIPLFTLSLGTSICSYAAQIIAYVSLPFLFQVDMHRSAIAAGLLITPWPLLVAAAAPVAGRLGIRYPASLLSSVGLVALAAGLFLLAVMPEVPADWNIGWRMALCGVGFGFFQTPNNTTIMTVGPLHRAGAAGGMLAVARVLGWCLGSALVGFIFAVKGPGGSTISLLVAGSFATVGAIASASRLFAGTPRAAG